MMPEPPRRFPPPWHADKMPGGYVVRDANGHAPQPKEEATVTELLVAPVIENDGNF
jgi:hypothetical protein